MKIMFNDGAYHFSVMGTSQELEGIIRVIYRLCKEIKPMDLSYMFKPSDRDIVHKLGNQLEVIVKQLESKNS